MALTWEQYAAQNWAGWDSSDPGSLGSAHGADRPSLEEEKANTPAWQAYKAGHIKRQEFFGRHNQWQDYLAGSGARPSSVGVKNKHEEGQSIFSGWDQNWKDAQANDSRAQEFMNSKDYGAFNKEYENPWVAYQNWQNVQGRQKSNNPHSSSDWRPMSGGGYWDVVGGGSGRKTVQYDKFGRPTGGAPNGGSPSGYSGYGPTSSGYAGSTGGLAGSVGGGGGMAATDYNSWDDYKRRQQGGGAGFAPNDPPMPPGGGGAGSQGDYGGTFSIPGYDGPSTPNFNFEDQPEFRAPRFRAPTGVTMLNDPGYRFRLEQGMDALESSKAAQGLLRGGGTLKGLQEYGQNYASQEFQNVYNRSLAEYDRNFGAARAEFDPRMQGWQTRTGFAGQGGLMGFQQQYDQWRQMQDWYLQMYNQQMQLAAGDKPEKPEA